jgi:uncharacterized protein involved in exopolysaccharide biosynthesis
MRLTITFNQRDLVVPVDVASDMTVGDLKAYIETESNVAASNQILVYRTQPLDDDSKPLSHYKVEQDEMLVVVERPPAVAAGSSSSGSQPK